MSGSSEPPVSVREAELNALPLWVGTDLVELGEWVLRTVPHAPGLRLRRTNSCLAVGVPGVPLGEAVDDVRRFYHERGREPLAQVEVGSAIELALLELGWQAAPVELAPFQVASVPVALAAAGAAAASTTRIDLTRLEAVIHVEGVEAGRARAELNGGWLGVHGLEVDEALRRRGLGRALMASLLRLGAEHGATVAWLEVAVSNQPALRLYEGLAFARHHTCRYLTGPR